MAALSGLHKEIEAYLDETLSDDARRDLFITIAGEQISAFEDGWKGALSSPPDFQHFVDGRPSGSPAQVKIPDGFVSERVVTIQPVIKRAVELLDQFTKVVTGDYKSKTKIYRNDAEISGAGNVFDRDDLVVIGNISDFARKAERRGFNSTLGATRETGLFASVAAILKKEFRGSLVPIYFTFRALADERVPVIAIGEGATSAGRRPRGSGGGRNVTAKSFAQAYARAKGR
jgi:hypothetical protein